MNQLRIGAWCLSVLVALGWLGMPGTGQGQTPLDLFGRAGEVQAVTPSRTPRTFGTASQTAHVISGPEFEPSTSGATWSYVSPMNGPFTKASSVSMLAQVRLPAGAVVTSVELEGCDTGVLFEVLFGLQKIASPNGPVDFLTPIGSTGGTPGCGFFPVTPLPAFTPLVIDNENNVYQVFVGAPGAGATFAAVRVYYTLQVSPAPAVASFGDVPTSHPFFRFVEALKTSGITGGCQASPPLFCPDAPLTRGQMAAFLSLALGLHFAP